MLDDDELLLLLLLDEELELLLELLDELDEALSKWSHAKTTSTVECKIDFACKMRLHMHSLCDSTPVRLGCDRRKKIK